MASVEMIIINAMVTDFASHGYADIVQNICRALREYVMGIMVNHLIAGITMTARNETRFVCANNAQLNAKPLTNAPVSPPWTVMMVNYAGQNMENQSFVIPYHVPTTKSVMSGWFAKAENVSK